MILSLISTSLAARCNAIMDTLQFHFSTSIFVIKGDDYNWDPSKSWINKYVNGDPKQGQKQVKILGRSFDLHPYFTDAWHKYKSLMLLYLCVAIASSGLDFLVLYVLLGGFSVGWLSVIMAVYFGAAGIIWNKTFNYYYDKKLRL